LNSGEVFLTNEVRNEIPTVAIDPNEHRQQILAEEWVLGHGDHRGCYKRRCAICTIDFYASVPSARYCGTECATIAYLIQRRKKNNQSRQKDCGFCGKRFRASRRDARFCSGACRQAAHRRAFAAGQIQKPAMETVP
jgi:site-specific DNA recombinase